MIGIIGAMDEEVAALKEKMEVEKVTDRASSNLWQVSWKVKR